MKRVRVFVVATLALLCLSIAAQADDLVLNGFDVDPFDSIIDEGGQVVARTEVPGYGIEDWSFEARVKVTDWTVYARLYVGVEGIGSVGGPNGWDQCAGVLTTPPWTRTVHLLNVHSTGQENVRQTNAIPGAGPPDDLPRSFIVNVQYKYMTGFRLILREPLDPTPLVDTGYLGFVDLKPERVIVKVNDWEDNGSIAYNAANRSVDFYSIAGMEGATPYEIGGSIDGLALVHGLHDSILPDVIPEPSSIVALAGGLIALLGVRRRK